jgi:hypothetical protein
MEGKPPGHTQITNFGVCAAREEPLLKHVFIRTIRKRSHREHFYARYQ